jgi:hypothetical protein
MEAFDVSEEMCENDGLAVYMSHHDKHATLEPLKIAFFGLIVVPSR